MSNQQDHRAIFDPGQWLGSYAAGLPGRGSSVSAPQTAQLEDTVRVGEKAAKQFPWISSIFGRLPGAAGGVMRFTRPGSEMSFYNNTNRPVYVDEIRIYAMSMPQATDLFGNPAPFTGTLPVLCGLRLYDRKTEYIRDWLPLWNFQTESNRCAEVPRFRGAFKFPSSYFINKGNSFVMRTRVWWPLLGPDVRSSVIDAAFSLQGQRENSTFPAKLMRQVTIATTGATPNNPLFTMIPFNENRDLPLYDVDATHFGFGLRDPTDAAAVCYPWPALMWVMLQFQPPQGPKWMADDDWIPLWGLQDQPGPLVTPGPGIPNQHDMVIHRPVRPYVILPREELSVELRNNLGMLYNPSENVPGWTEAGRGIPVWCTMYGRQESLA